ncbi:o-succinylbenzoate--CoA ligase [Brachybacterium endophyticum]|uniref:O-succinylbenzoate--CoA ligase n=1 Tax=Brachybacterium endophyticum TaxID=2182385 RepID=A0A2U2RP43_9MICO|nr:AMP-binding protein [Brachybacterium endophyticum]PWH07565.1 o-succinylbenzoate--CoA ligase [Brachybacterium endophyticum]
MTRIVPLRAPQEQVLERLRAVRADGDVPLIGDERWSDEQWGSVRDLAASAPLPEGTAWAALTSGSSGAPRIVVRTAESWSRSFPAVTALLEAGPEDEVLLPAPASSSLTLFSLAHAEDGGPRPVLGRTGGGGSEDDGTGRSRAGHSPTAVHGTPQGLRALLASDDPLTVRTALVGGSDLDPALRTAAEAHGIRVIAYYGAAELSFVAVDDGTGLRPFPGVDLEIRDGELWVRSPYAALGYLGRPAPLRTDGAWCTVGDLAEIESGVLRLRGRADGAILTASATVVPEEVEAALRSVPGIADAVVFGVPAAAVGHLVAALVEVESEATHDPDLRRSAEAALTPASRPRLWFTGQVPRTPAGKLARAEALRLVLDGEVTRRAG